MFTMICNGSLLESSEVTLARIEVFVSQSYVLKSHVCGTVSHREDAVV